MPSFEVSVERRLAAPHPGPIIKRDFVDAMGLSVAELATALDMDVARLTAMLEGRASIDVDASIRLARGLGLAAERLMQMQTRADFGTARRQGQYGAVSVVRGNGAFPFPQVGFVTGRLGRTADDAGAHGSFFFQEDVTGEDAETYAGLHALWRGDRLRVYDTAGEPIWTGPVLQNLDGRTLLPFASTVEWHGWFARGARADLAIGHDHAQFFARMRDT